MKVYILPTYCVIQGNIIIYAYTLIHRCSHRGPVERGGVQGGAREYEQGEPQIRVPELDGDHVL